MIQSFVFSDGKLVGTDLEPEALRLVRADPGLVLWVDLTAPTPVEARTILEQTFGFHALAIEDCVTPSSLPKVEDYEDYLFIVFHAVGFTRAEKFQSNELNLFLGRDFIVTYHDRPLAAIKATIERSQKNLGTVRGPDRIAHTVLDQIVDGYQPVLDELRSEIDECEERALGKADPRLIEDLLEVRKELALLRGIVRPQREVITRLAQGASRVVRPKLLPYFRNLRDHLARIDEQAAAYADQLLIAFDLYLNRSASEANEGIKVLTALTAITLPPILIGTWYGMNFEHMPELRSPYGYWGALAAMVVTTAAMFAWVKARKWF